MNKGRLFGVAFLLMLLAGGIWWYACAKIAAQVGEASISEADIAYRISVGQAYGTSIESPAALMALIKDTLEREVAAQVGVMVTEKELDDFSAGVDKHSKAPTVLQAVKQGFGGDDDAYRRIYLAPKVVNRKLRTWFSRDVAMQKKPRQAIQRAYTLAVAGNDFGQVGKALGLTFAKQDYTTKQNDAPDALKAYFPEGMAMLSPGFRKILEGLKPGAMAQTIAEDDASYRVVRLLEKREGTYKTAEIIAAKESFDPWFKTQTNKIPVRIKDKQLGAAIAAKYPGSLRGCYHRNCSQGVALILLENISTAKQPLKLLDII